MSFTAIRKVGNQLFRGLFNVQSLKVSHKFSPAADSQESRQRKNSVWPKEKFNEEYYFHQKEKEQLKALKEKLKHTIMKKEEPDKMI